jgi:hypothetical protein
VLGLYFSHVQDGSIEKKENISMVKQNRKTSSNDQMHTEYSEPNEFSDVPEELLENVTGGVWMPNALFHRGSKTVIKVGPDGRDLITRYSKSAYDVLKKLNGKAPGHGATVGDIE